MNLPPMNRVSDKFRRTLLRVSAHTGIPPLDILGKSRQADKTLARQLFQYLLVTDHQVDPSEIALRYATKRTGIYSNVKRIEGFLAVQDPLIRAHLAALRSAKAKAA